MGSGGIAAPAWIHWVMVAMSASEILPWGGMTEIVRTAGPFGWGGATEIVKSHDILDVLSHDILYRLREFAGEGSTMVEPGPARWISRSRVVA